MIKVARQKLFLIFFVLISAVNTCWAETKAELDLRITPTSQANPETQKATSTEAANMQTADSQAIPDLRITPNMLTPFNGNNAFIFGVVSWQDSNVLAKIEGPSYQLQAAIYGAELAHRSYLLIADYSCFFDMGILFGKADIVNKNTDILYRQNNVSVFGAMFNLGAYAKPVAEVLTVGFSLPMIYREIALKVPNISYEFKTTRKFIPYYALDLAWKINDSWSLNQEFAGAFLPKDGSLWKVELAWAY